jgi:hypothetical protein
VSHYFAAGERVELDATDDVAVDLDIAASLGADTIPLEALGTPLRGRLVLVPSAEVPGSLDGTAALQPVYRAGGALIVVLPEVRVEAGSVALAQAVRDCVGAGPVPVHVVLDDGDLITLRPTSGRGADALDVANLLHDEVGPLMAQPRFLRITPRP